MRTHAISRDAFCYTVKKRGETDIQPQRVYLFVSWELKEINTTAGESHTLRRVCRRAYVKNRVVVVLCVYVCVF